MNVLLASAVERYTLPSYALRFHAVAEQLQKLGLLWGTMQQQGPYIDENRNVIVESALNAKDPPSHIFFWDTDIELTAAQVQDLLQEKAVVSGLYFTRGEKPAPIAAWENNGEIVPIAPAVVQLYRNPPRAPTPLAVDLVGSGCLAVPLWVFQKLQPPWFKVVLGTIRVAQSEDTFFCRKLKKAKIPLYVQLDVYCPHITEVGTGLKEFLGDHGGSWLGV